MRSDESKLVSIEDAAARLGLKPPTLRLWSAKRKLASVKLGRRRLIPLAEIERLIESNLTPALPEHSR
jgi:excisionase family DNA binding protein